MKIVLTDGTNEIATLVVSHSVGPGDTVYFEDPAYGYLKRELDMARSDAERGERMALKLDDARQADLVKCRAVLAELLWAAYSLSRHDPALDLLSREAAAMNEARKLLDNMP